MKTEVKKTKEVRYWMNHRDGKFEFGINGSTLGAVLVAMPYDAQAEILGTKATYQGGCRSDVKIIADDSVLFGEKAVVFDPAGYGVFFDIMEKTIKTQPFDSTEQLKSLKVGARRVPIKWVAPALESVKDKDAEEKVKKDSTGKLLKLRKELSNVIY